MPIHRTIKNVVKNYTPAEIKVREATSNDPWGPPTTLMNEIAELTYNSMALAEIMNMIWKRMSDQGKNWRHVFKSLNLLEYLAKVGSPQVSERCKSQIHALQGLNEFSYYEEGKDCGACIREKSKQFVSLLKDSERFRNERMKALAAKERLAQSTGLGTSKMSHSSSDRYLSTSGRVGTTQAPLSADLEAARPSSYGEEDLQLQLALAMSKEEHEEEVKRRKGDEFKLQLALEESKKINEEFQKTLQSFDQDILLQNSPLKISNKSNLPSSSTWDGNLTQPSSSMDPWGVPTPLISPPQRIQHLPKVADPWGDSFLPKEPEPVRAANDPWSPVAIQSSVTSSPWNPLSSGGPVPIPTQPAHGFNNGFGTPKNNADILDSEFDLLSIRSTSGQEPEIILQPLTTMSANSKDYLGDLGEDLLSGTIWSQQSTQQHPEDDQSKSGKKLKSMEEFLGSNANLVNLNDLVTKPPPSTIANPFAMSTNPRPTPVPIDPTAAHPSFGAPWPMALDANPAPAFRAGRIPSSYPQHNNPFL